MRILYLSQYFPPEVGATQARAYEMARGLVRNGHEVTILTEVPCHPHGVVDPAYRRKLWVRRDLEGIDVIHVRVRPSPLKTMRTRLLFYISYMIMATIAGLLVVRGRYDLVYCTSPPLFAGGAGLALSYLRRTKLVFEVRDLWPESAVELGELRNRTAIRMSSMLARRCYRRSRRVVVVTEGIRRRLLQLGVPVEKVVLIPNGSNTDIFRPRPVAANELRRELGIGEDFLAVFAGTVGLAYSVETVLEAADRLRNRRDIRFLVIGAGPQLGSMRRDAQERRLENLDFADQVPYEAMATYLTAADVALIPLRSVPIMEGALPVRMFDAWACGCPTMLGVSGGEAMAATEESGAGMVVPPEDPAALAAAIVALAADRDRGREMGERGRDFVSARFSRQKQADELSELLENVVGASRVER